MTSAVAMARACDEYVAALWLGESEDVYRFAAWLRNHWAVGPAEPSYPPAAVSRAGGSGTGIRWYDAGEMITGYIPGVERRCYQIPRDANPPVIASPALRTAFNVEQASFAGQ